MLDENDPRFRVWAAMGLCSSEFAKLELTISSLFARLMNGDDTLALRLFRRAPSVPARLELLKVAFNFSGALAPTEHEKRRKEVFTAIKTVSSKRNKVAHASAGLRHSLHDGKTTVGAILENEDGLEVLTIGDILSVVEEIIATNELVSNFLQIVATETGHPSGLNPR